MNLDPETEMFDLDLDFILHTVETFLSLMVFIIWKYSLRIDNDINPLQRGVAFLYPLKTSENLENIRKPKGFLMLSGGIEKQHRVVMG